MTDAVDREHMDGRDAQKPWWYFMGGLSILTVVALLALGLFLQYWQNRPINYSMHTALLADELEQVLIDQFVPKTSIRRGAAERRENAASKAYWNFYRFEVDLPRNLSPDGLKELVRNEMLLRNVTLMDAHEPGAEAAWSLGRGDLEFARVVLNARPGEARRRDDLRELSISVADAVERALKGAGVPEETLFRSVAKDRKDQDVRWAMTRFAAVLPPGLSPGDLRARMGDSLTFEGVSFATERIGYGTMIAVKYGERRFAEVLCSPTVEMETAARDRAPEQSLATEPAGLPPLDAVKMAASTAAPAPVIEPLPPDTGPGTVVIEPPAAGKPREKTPPPPAPRDKTVRIAIILDDGGNNRAQCERVLAMDTGLTLALLPHTPHALETASKAAKLGLEVMLHMPMETNSKPEKAAEGMVLTSMTKEGIQWRMKEALTTLISVKGVNNHTGSKFTSDEKAMRAVLEELKERDLFFIDSWTTNGSIAYDLAREMGVKTAQRDVFLDHDRTAEAIQRQFDALLARAKAKGSAIGIGHFQSPHTLALLERELPKLSAKGIKLVHVSELVR